ncbi:uncharacterized protein LOC144477537, partial [Augochlora pura]
MVELLKNFTILQINLHRCRLAHDLLTQYVYENEVDIILISEPYRILDTCCYISPNIPMRVFLDILNELDSEICKSGPDLTIVAGDFNAKAVTWGSRFTDKRGFEILEMAARNDLRPIRSRGDFTFERNGHKSLIDILLCSKQCVTGLEISEILEVYTASDHRYLRHVFKSKVKD